MKKQSNVVASVATVETAAAAIIEAAQCQTRNNEAHARMGKIMVGLYIAHCGSDDDFKATFGDGKKIAGSLREAVVNGIPTFKDGRYKDPAQAKTTLDVLKVRLAEARRLRRDGGMANPEDNNLQAAAKRYAKQKAAAPKAPDGAASPKVVFSDDASMEDIAEALSLWVSKHGAAVPGLARKLADFMPVQLKRMPRAS